MSLDEAQNNLALLVPDISVECQRDTGNSQLKRQIITHLITHNGYMFTLGYGRENVLLIFVIMGDEDEYNLTLLVLDGYAV